VIAYFDSSSIVKWFFDEAFSDLARDVRDKANIALTSLIAFPEVLSAFNRAFREGRCSKSQMQVVRKEFVRVWSDFQWIRINEELVLQADELVFTNSLKGFDAVHLASALLLKEDETVTVFFSCFDKNLNHAARERGFLIHEI
jgi:predicted nucleic acid-binding protein